VENVGFGNAKMWMLLLIDGLVGIVSKGKGYMGDIIKNRLRSDRWYSGNFRNCFKKNVGFTENKQFFTNISWELEHGGYGPIGAIFKTKVDIFLAP
jgi:hypothetical protein